MTETAGYYESILPGLGSDFLDEIERLCELLVQHPELGFEYLHGACRLPARRFPYTVIYRIRPSCIEVAAIAHQHRKPGYWKGDL